MMRTERGNRPGGDTLSRLRKDTQSGAKYSMNITIFEISDLSAGIPRTLEDYHARVLADNQWYYSREAMAYRMAYHAKFLFPNVEWEELVRHVGFLIDTEASAQKRGVPQNLRGGNQA